MKKIMFFLFISVSLFAQEFTVVKISGVAKLLRGTSEKWENININQKLNVSDLILTEDKSLVQLKKNDKLFIINGDVAIGLNNIKKVTTNELILALTLDEIRNVPKIKRNSISKNTAVYGSKIKNVENVQISDTQLGTKKINGAKLLSNSGYVESSIIVAKEVFRNYPKISDNFYDRLYFAELLTNITLYEEASSEFARMEMLSLNEEQEIILKQRIEEVNRKIVEE